MLVISPAGHMYMLLVVVVSWLQCTDGHEAAVFRDLQGRFVVCWLTGIDVQSVCQLEGVCDIGPGEARQGAKG